MCLLIMIDSLAGLKTNFEGRRRKNDLITSSLFPEKKKYMHRDLFFNNLYKAGLHLSPFLLKVRRMSCDQRGVSVSFNKQRFQFTPMYISALLVSHGCFDSIIS